MALKDEVISQLKSKIEHMERGSASLGAKPLVPDTAEDPASAQGEFDAPGSSGRRFSFGIRAGSDTEAQMISQPVSKAASTAEKSDSDQAAFAKIAALVNARDRSELDVRSRLQKAGFAEGAIEVAVERAKQCGFIDDMRFAEVLIRSRLSQGKGSSGIARELAGNGIDLDSVPGWPEEFETASRDEYERAMNYLERHPSRSKNKREGAYRKLVQRGYSSSVASDVARRWAEGNI